MNAHAINRGEYPEFNAKNTDCFFMERGSEREIYMADGSGRYWDASDDVEREEAQSFSWTMDSNLLTFTCRMRLGGVMVREYVVTFVDDETLVYCDAYGGSFMWDKVAAGFNDRPVAAR